MTYRKAAEIKGKIVFVLSRMHQHPVGVVVGQNPPAVDDATVHQLVELMIQLKQFVVLLLIIIHESKAYNGIIAVKSVELVILKNIDQAGFPLF